MNPDDDILKRYGIKLEPDIDRNTPYHREIVYAVRIPNTRSGNRCTLDCGHTVITFGNLELAHGKVLCEECKNAGAK